ncbi:MAG: serine--tRNA ligase, partial [Porphyromonadaceae bacterium]|nr:serine--tRNA ligase [Porphyromonadaceae bacterium]
MLTLKQIKENTEAVIERLRKKQFEAREAINEVLNFDEIRRRSQQELDASLSRQKALAKEIGDLMKQGAKEQAESIRSQVAQLKELSKSLEEKKTEAEAKIREILLSVPNLPADIVPEGATAEDNVCVKTGGEMPALDATAEPHWELAKDYDLIDFELGVKISGAGFPVYK